MTRSMKSCPGGRVGQSVQHLACFGNAQNTLGFTPPVVGHVDRARVAISQVDSSANVLGNLCRKSHPHTRLLDAILVAADAADVRGVGEDAPRLILEAVP